VTRKAREIGGGGEEEEEGEREEEREERKGAASGLECWRSTTQGKDSFLTGLK
jgi:hypothetical protein